LATRRQQISIHQNKLIKSAFSCKFLERNEIKNEKQNIQQPHQLKSSQVKWKKIKINKIQRKSIKSAFFSSSIVSVTKERIEMKTKNPLFTIYFYMFIIIATGREMPVKSGNLDFFHFSLAS